MKCIDQAGRHVAGQFHKLMGPNCKDGQHTVFMLVLLRWSVNCKKASFLFSRESEPQPDSGMWPKASCLIAYLQCIAYTSNRANVAFA